MKICRGCFVHLTIMGKGGYVHIMSTKNVRVVLSTYAKMSHGGNVSLHEKCRSGGQN